MAEPVIRIYSVAGMSCEHCRSSVLEEVGELHGVEAVEVDLASGQLEVRGPDIDDDLVRGAVEQAGYRLTAGSGR